MRIIKVNLTDHTIREEAFHTKKIMAFLAGEASSQGF